MENQTEKPATPSEQRIYALTEKERAAFAELHRQAQALMAMRTGMLQLIAFQQSLTGEWTLSDDATVLVKKD